MYVLTSVIYPENASSLLSRDSCQAVLSTGALSLKKKVRNVRSSGGDARMALFFACGIPYSSLRGSQCEPSPASQQQSNCAACVVFQEYPASLEWDNLAAFTPENVDGRPQWYTDVHWPTRVAVQRAFEAGVADFREIIEREYHQLQAEDAQAAREQHEERERQNRMRTGDVH